MFIRIFCCGVFCAISATAPAAERISNPLRNPAATGTSRAPSVSADGRFVAFESTSRLTRDDASPHTDVYVYDRTTKTTRLVSDDRGGDQPVISANGRYVAYRSLESALTRIRVRDLERGGVPLTASFPIDVAAYDRTAQLAAITPDGRYVAYVVRPQPNVDAVYGQGYGHQIVVADTRLPRPQQSAKRVPYRDPAIYYDGQYLNNLGRMAISADAKFVVFDTTDKLTADDNNGVSDVYRAAVDTISLQRLSKASGVPDLGGATQPVMALDGNTALFLCENPLVLEDTDERTSVYLSGSGNNFAVTKYIPTQSAPAALAAQATVSGKFFAFLDNKGRAFVRDVNGEDDLPIAAKANIALLSPILSGDDLLAVFATKASNLSPGDGPSSIDVFATANPSSPPERAAPVVSLTLSNGTALVPENTSITIGASATPGSGTLKLLIVEVDGNEKFRTTSSTLAPQNFTVTRGIHDVRARAFNDAWIEGLSELKPLIVVPAAGTLGITGTVSLERSDAPDGSATFNATLRIDNRRPTGTQPLQVVVKLTSLPQIMSDLGAGNFLLVPDRGEFILTVIDVPALPTLGTTTVNFGGTTPATEVIGDSLQGNGWIVLTQLREQSGPNFVDIESPARVLTTAPRLEENTDLPNTGIPVVGTPNESGFDAGLLQSVTISGPASVAEGAGAAYSALAVFSNGSQACSPEWSLTGPNASRAMIDARGRLGTKSIDSSTKVTVRAAFGSVAATKEVTIKPTSPIISIRASVPTASEAGDPGQFRLLRTNGNKEELSVSYTVTGKATNGTDYAALSGTAVFGEGSSTAMLDVVPQQDPNFEGSESVIVTLEPGPGYRLNKKHSASLEIRDDEPFPVNQPDLTIRRGKGPTIGALVIDADPDEVSQELTANGRRGKPVKFTISLINRGDVPRDYTLRGGAAATAFTVQYLDGKTDVTADVIAGTFVVSQLPPGSARELSLIVTPTSETPIGGSLYTVIQAQADTKIDAVATLVERVK
jgi:WD40-like Beta Propeller Repeat